MEDENKSDDKKNKVLDKIRRGIGVDWWEEFSVLGGMTEPEK